MRFTDKFIILPVEIFSRETADIIGENNTPTDIVQERLDASRIVAYRRDFIEDEHDHVAVELDNGVTHVYALSVEEFEKCLNLYL